tara:strand:+ start:13 stop:804 length:792 start_codon:yes stop_codon:yes gene_type:complete
MFSGKQLLATLVGMVIATSVVLKHSENQIKENYWGTYPYTSVLSNGDGLHNKSVENYSNNPQGFLTVPGKYQSQLSPRFSNTTYGSVRYHLPSQQNLAVPRNPLGVANTVENFHQNKVAKPSQPDSKMSGPLNLPVSGMGKHSPTNPIMYNNLMFASKKDRLYAQGDPIRGDLPIAPCNTGWFQVSARPQNALRAGALQVMGGFDAGSSVSNLKMLDSGGSVTTNSGVNMQRPANSFVSQIGNQLKLQHQGTPVQSLNVASFP